MIYLLYHLKDLVFPHCLCNHTGMIYLHIDVPFFAPLYKAIHSIQNNIDIHQQAVINLYYAFVINMNPGLVQRIGN